MAVLVFLSPEGASARVPAELSVLSHTIRPLDDVAQTGECDLVIVDARNDLSWAKNTCLRLGANEVLHPTVLFASLETVPLLSRDWGFDDFIVDGARAAEIAARVALAIVVADVGQLITCGPITIDEAAYSASLDGDPLDLTYTEFELLKYLALHLGRVLSRETLLSEVWGYDYYGGTRTVDVHIRRLRAKLGHCDSFISTVRNVGYRFSPRASAT